MNENRRQTKGVEPKPYPCSCLDCKCKRMTYCNATSHRGHQHLCLTCGISCKKKNVVLK